MHASKLPILDFESKSKNLTKNKFVVLLESVNDPQNLGSILRNLHFLGLDNIIMSYDKMCEINSTVSTVSVGASE